MKPMLDPAGDLAGATPEKLARALLRNRNLRLGARRQPVVRDQVAVEQIPADQPRDGIPLLDEGSRVPMVVLAGEFGDVALRVLRADLVEHAVVGAFQHESEALHAVCVGLSADVLDDRVVDALVGEISRQPLVGRRLVIVDDRAGLGVLADKALQHLAVHAPDDSGPGFAAIPVVDADHHRLVDQAAPELGLADRAALRVRLVLALAAHIGLVDLNRACEILVIIVRPGLPDAVQHGRRRRLLHADVAGQLHARHSLEPNQAQIYRNGPLPQRDIRPRYWRAGADGEVGQAIRAPVGHRLRVRNLARAGRSALLAVPLAVWPDHRLEPLRRGFLGREHLHQLDDGESLAMDFAGAFFRHLRSPFLPSGNWER